MVENSEFVVLQLSPARLEEMLNTASMRGAIHAMQMCGVVTKDLLSRAELCRKFGRGKVNRLIEEGRLTPHQFGGGRPKFKLNEVLTLLN